VRPSWSYINECNRKEPRLPPELRNCELFVVRGSGFKRIYFNKGEESATMFDLSLKLSLVTTEGRTYFEDECE
jgi:hypothetical protein